MSETTAPSTAVAGSPDVKIEAACRQIEAAETELPLETLAEAAGLSPHHFHRRFKKALGVTPKAYGAALRDERVRDALARGTSITEAIYEAGFNSSGRFYEKATEVLGMSPRSYRAGGRLEQLGFSIAPCSLGEVLIVTSEKGVCAIVLGDRADDLEEHARALFPNAALSKAHCARSALIETVVALVDAPFKASPLPLDIRGTAFQRRVWEALQKIPAGETKTYAEIAAAIGAPKATRAVAGACAANKLAVAIPCHRVVRSDGSLSGYRWGKERKRALLDKERKD